MLKANPIIGGSFNYENQIIENGQIVDLLAIPSNDYYFENWDGDLKGTENPVSLEMNSDKNIIGNFKIIPFKRNIIVVGEGSYKQQVKGNTIEFIALPSNRSAFDSWSGDLSSTNPSLKVNLDKDYTITLNFKRKVSVKIDTAKTINFVQRNNSGTGIIPIAFVASNSFSEAKIKFKPVFGGKETEWINLSKADSLHTLGKIELLGGAYSANLQLKNGNAIVCDSTFNYFNVGEIFAVIGHSLAEGIDPYHIRDFDKIKSSVRTWLGNQNFSFWGRLGELIANRMKVPVFMHNDGIGGSSTVHWGMSSAGLFFNHAFFSWEKRHPYSAFENDFFKWIPKSGIRAVLVMHGENDRDDSEEDIVLNAKRYINYTREKLKYSKLEFSICRCGNANITNWYQKVLNSQTRIIKEVSNTSWGGFVNDLQGLTYRWDGIHLNFLGMEEAAKKWDAALNDEFFKNSTPYIP